MASRELSCSGGMLLYILVVALLRSAEALSALAFAPSALEPPSEASSGFSCLRGYA